MKLVLQITVTLFIWLFALYGVLQIGHTSGLDAHAHGGVSICGPWGCGPPVEALIGWHGFLVLLVVPPVGLLIRFCSAGGLKWLGIGLCASSLVMVIGVCAYQSQTWLPNIPDGQPSYFVRRCLFAIVTATDLPALPAALSGVAVFCGAVFKSQSSRHPVTPPANSPFAAAGNVTESVGD